MDRRQGTRHGLRTEARGNTTRSEQNFRLEAASNSWLRIGLSAKDKQKKFCNLFCHLTVENFREAYRAVEGSKAVGIDGQTKLQYGRNLEGNLGELVTRLHKGTYRPLPKKRAFIPKADGRQRPIAISAFEDKLVEWVVAKLLTRIFEPIFIRNSFGFREKKSAFDAVKATFLTLKDNKRRHVVEIDLKNFFDTVPHRKLILLLQERITDRRLLGLISRFLTAGILEQTGTLRFQDSGTPQGSVMSPVLANVFLHHALDEWFLTNYASTNSVIVRYADDAVFVFQDEAKARTFRDDLQVRIESFGLTLNEDKSGHILFTKTQGNVFNFLGFTFFWSRDKGSSARRLRVKTEKTRLFKKIGDFTRWVKEARNMPTRRIWEIAAAKLRGHYNYYGVHTNRARLNHFYFAVIGSLFKWLNRRSQRKSYSWERFAAKLRQDPLPLPPPTSMLKPLLERSFYAH